MPGDVIKLKQICMRSYLPSLPSASLPEGEKGHHTYEHCYLQP